ncbi:MAG TPA: methyltransferase domain-containing protein [Ignavibacteriaceae bacterium]|nr:methyltransferase domain-containing protein [Ignavibacteriaceae bacterium]
MTDKENLIGKYYSGVNADTYELRRKCNPKWQFEEETLKRVLDDLKTGINDLIDAPVGSGRFLEFYKTLGKEKIIYGIDYSGDMLKIALEKCNLPNISFIKKDIINDKLQVSADLSICYRFLNLINHDEAAKVLNNLLTSAKKYSLIAIRTVEDDYSGEMFVENKIYLHRLSYVKRIISENNFEVERKFDFTDKREGQYSVFLCRKISERYPILSSRINKNLKLVYTYGEKEPQGKIYQVKNVGHAEFIKEISAREEVKKYFPEIKNVQGDFVNAEWINGRLADSSEWIDVIKVLADIQNLRYSGSSSFDYVEDIVLPRFYLTHPLTGIKLYKEIESIIKEESKRYSFKISHPDVIPGNIINDNGQPMVIDNELLCYSLYHRIDILNLLHNLKPDNRLPVFLRYCSLAGLSIEALKLENRFLQAIWLARQVGSFIIKEKTDSAVNLINSYLKRDNILPLNLYDLRAASGFKGIHHTGSSND